MDKSNICFTGLIEKFHKEDVDNVCNILLMGQADGRHILKTLATHATDENELNVCTSSCNMVTRYLNYDIIICIIRMTIDSSCGKQSHPVCPTIVTYPLGVSSKR